MPNLRSSSPIGPRIPSALLAAAVLVQCWGQQTMKYGVRVQAGPMDSILLKDYAPASSLVASQTRVPRARFAVVDAHTHSSMNNVRTPEDVTAWVQVMDLCQNQVGSPE